MNEFAADELVAEFNLSWHSAAEQIAFASAVAERLPRTFAALAAGQIHPVHVKIIEDVTRVLSAGDAARADEILAEAAGFGLLDTQDARALVSAAARHPRTRWCLTRCIRTALPPRMAAPTAATAGLAAR